MWCRSSTQSVRNQTASLSKKEFLSHIQEQSSPGKPQQPDPELEPHVSSITTRYAKANMKNTMANQIPNLTKNEYTLRSLFDSECGSKSPFSKSSNIDFRLSSPFKIYNSYGANPVLAIDIISPDSQELYSNLTNF